MQFTRLEAGCQHERADRPLLAYGESYQPAQPPPHIRPSRGEPEGSPVPTDIAGLPAQVLPVPGCSTPPVALPPRRSLFVPVPISPYPVRAFRGVSTGELIAVPVSL